MKAKNVRRSAYTMDHYKQLAVIGIHYDVF